MDVAVSYCIVNTEQRELLLRCLDAVARDRAALTVTSEVLVLDNASRDGSAGAARAHPAVDTLIRLSRRTGKGANDTQLLQRARGSFCLLLNEDAELQPGATAALLAALEEHPGAAAAGAELVDEAGARRASAWRFPTPAAALLTAFGLHRRFVVQSRGNRTRDVDWSQSAALLVRRDAAEAIGWFDPAFFVYSDEVDFCKRLRDAGWSVLFAPAAHALHHEAAGAPGRAPDRRVVAQPRPLRAQAPRRGRRARGALAHGVDVRRPQRAGARRPRARRAPLPPPRARHAVPRPRRGARRGGRRLQPRHAPVTRRGAGLTSGA